MKIVMYLQIKQWNYFYVNELRELREFHFTNYLFVFHGNHLLLGK